MEQTINTALSMDPAAQSKLKPLNGCVLEVHIRNANQSLFIGTKGGKVVLLSAEQAPTVTLSGTVSAFIQVAVLRKADELLRRREIEFSGDAVRAQQIQRFASQLDIDWEGLLAKFVGDTPARLLGSGAKQMLTIARTFSQNFVGDLEEYMKFEMRFLPSRRMSEKQFQAIDQVRLATDRLEARVKSLKNRLKRT